MELAIRRRCSKAWRSVFTKAASRSDGIRLNLVGKIASVFDVDNAIARLGLERHRNPNAARQP